MADSKIYANNTLAYFLLTYYGIDDSSANFVLSPYEIKVMEGKIKASKIPKSFRTTSFKKRKQR